MGRRRPPAVVRNHYAGPNHGHSHWIDEKTLLIGDHLLVDKLAYAPSGSFSKYILPYEEPKHGDIIVFRFPGDITNTFVKRVIGLPGDHLHMVKNVLYRNGAKLNEPYVYHKLADYNEYRDNLPASQSPFQRSTRLATPNCSARC